jgi:hypothetical protein
MFRTSEQKGKKEGKRMQSDSKKKRKRYVLLGANKERSSLCVLLGVVSFFSRERNEGGKAVLV